VSESSNDPEVEGKGQPNVSHMLNRLQGAETIVNSGNVLSYRGQYNISLILSMHGNRQNMFIPPGSLKSFPFSIELSTLREQHTTPCGLKPSLNTSALCTLS